MTSKHSSPTFRIAHAPAGEADALSRRAALLAIAGASVLVLTPSHAAPALAQPVGAGFVYTADEHGNTVSRIDLGSGKVDTVAVPVSPHNVQFVPGRNWLLAVGQPAGGSGGHGHESGSHDAAGHGNAPGRLLVLDSADLAAGPRASIEVGAHPAHVVADADGRHAYVSNADDDTVSVVDLARGRQVAAMATGDYPHGLRLSPDGRSLYVADVKDGSVSVIDTQARKETARIQVGAAPVQVGFTPDGRRVYVSLRDEDKVAVIDTPSRQVIGRIEVGCGPIQVHATPDGRFVYVANEGSQAEPDDRVSVIEVAGGRVVATIRTGPGAHGVAASTDGRHVFVTNIGAGTVSQIAVASQSVVRSYPVGKGPNGVTYQTP